MIDGQSQRIPYPGLRSFRREETDLFFGREDCTNAMVDRLAATRFLAVLGSSGTGKSSLVKTGLLDALELGLMAKAGSRWAIAEFRPGGAPLRNLALGLLKSGLADDDRPTLHDADLLRSYLARGPRAVIEWCKAGHLREGTNLLLLVDQFEELFRYQDYAGREQAEAFAALLLESAREAGLDIYVVITMRSEYLGACSLIEGMSDAINTGIFLTPRMTREQCREAIVGPAAVCNIDIEPGLVNQLLNDLANFAPWSGRDDDNDQLDRIMRRADQLPLLQYTLNRMWLRARERSGTARITLTSADYVAIGGLSGALNAHADQIMADLGKARAPVVECVFRALTAGSTVADAVRRPTRFGDLVAACGGDEAAVRAVVDAFRAPGVNFLVPELDPKNEIAADVYIDISHESLIRQWKKLSEWLEAEARAAQQWRRLIDRHASGEMLRGRELANLSAWKSETRPNAAWARRYGGDFDSAIAFLNESQRKQRLKQAIAVAATIASFAIITLFAVDATLQRSHIAAASKEIELRNERIVAALKETDAQRDRAENEAHRAENERKRTEDTFKVLTSFLDTIVFSIASQYASPDSRPSEPPEARAAREAEDRAGERPATEDRSTSESRPETPVDPGLAITTSALEGVRRLVAANPTDNNIQRYLMLSLNMLGDVKLRQKDVDGAATAFDESLRIVRSMLKSDPDHPFWQEDLAVTLFRVASIKSRRQEFDEERKLYDEALPHYRRYVARNPNNEGLLKNFQDHLGRYAELLVRLGDRPQARRLFEERLTVRRKLVEIKPNEVAYIENLSTALDRVAQLLRDDGEFAQARKVFEEALTVDRGFFKRFPARRTALEYVTISLGRLGDLDRDVNQLESALRYYNEALPLQRKLAAIDPAALGPRRSLAGLLSKIADVTARRGAREQALKFRQEELGIRRSLLKDDPKNVPLQQDVSATLDGLGNILRDLGRLDEARAAYDEQLAIDDSLVKADPDNTAKLLDLAWSLNRLGDLDERLKLYPNASKHFEAALTIQRRLIAREPGSLTRQRALATILVKLSNVRRRMLDYATALAFGEEALGVRRRLAARDPKDVSAQVDLSSVLETVGLAHQGLRNFEAALKLFLEELTIDRRLVANQPDSVPRLADLQWTLNLLGNFARTQLKDLPRARAFMVELVDVSRRLVDREPSQPNRHNALVGNLRNLASLLLEMNDLEAAKQTYGQTFAAADRRLALARANFEKAPKTARSDVLSAYLDAGWYAILAGRTPTAVQYLETALAINPDAPWLTVNLGHAYLLLGRYDDALKLYRAVMDIKREGPGTYANEIRDDYALFRRLGIAVPDMARIESELPL